mmetsp:Transcript_18982/g.60640  ORF Transcript_18982/g.60640 Transcript_18982/m.60640 type:complete len:359 (+) Transcript_18982:2262-3338(+)
MMASFHPARSNAGCHSSTPSFIAFRHRSGTEGSMWYVIGFAGAMRRPAARSAAASSSLSAGSSLQRWITSTLRLVVRSVSGPDSVPTSVKRRSQYPMRSSAARGTSPPSSGGSRAKETRTSREGVCTDTRAEVGKASAPTSLAPVSGLDSTTPDASHEDTSTSHEVPLMEYGSHPGLDVTTGSEALRQSGTSQVPFSSASTRSASGADALRRDSQRSTLVPANDLMKPGQAPLARVSSEIVPFGGSRSSYCGAIRSIAPCTCGDGSNLNTVRDPEVSGMWSRLVVPSPFATIAETTNSTPMSSSSTSNHTLAGRPSLSPSSHSTRKKPSVALSLRSSRWWKAASGSNARGGTPGGGGG